MKHNKYKVGLDIGTTKIVVMVGRENQYGKVEILGYGIAKSEGIASGVVTNLVKTISAINLAIRQAQAQVGSDFPISEVIVGIAGQHIESRAVEGFTLVESEDAVINVEDIDRLNKQIMEVNQIPGKQIIHILPQAYYVNNDPQEIIEPVGVLGKVLKGVFELVVGDTNAINLIKRCATDANLKVKDVILEPLASATAVLTEDEKEMGVALVDIGGGTTDIAIFKNGVIRYTAVIPYGGNIITSDIATGFEILVRDAESCKVQFGSAWPNGINGREGVTIPKRSETSKEKVILFQDLSKVIHARLSEIIQMVYGEIINYGHMVPKNKLSAGIVLTGGGSQMKNITQLVQYITGMETRIGYPNTHLAAYTKDASTSPTSPIFSTAIGLVMSAIQEQKQEEMRLNFKNRGYEPQPIIANEVVESAPKEEIPAEPIEPTQPIETAKPSKFPKKEEEETPNEATEKEDNIIVRTFNSGVNFLKSLFDDDEKMDKSKDNEK